ncbi:MULTISPECIES: hypothetical protein [Actinosynnema]|uniref:hypothetical protein n=1 Tax=Actinosynnema TaxID=40566 RepID=UPI0020A5A878|nr:hypothetical protein [Actinosynnema pretiosum]MCP2093057.1 hypothetical protein [Actinosynnema pretiosum]
MAGNVRLNFNQAALNNLAAEVTQKWAQLRQPLLDKVHQECAGKPVDVVKQHLATTWHTETGEPLTEPQLTEWATAISEGTRLTLTT